MPRFFINKENIINSENIANITGEDVNHIKNVLRSKADDILTLCDGTGYDYSVRIEKIEKEFISTRILDIRKSITEPPIEVTLFQGLPKSDKMDLIIQKSVELGVKRIVPIFTERTVVRIDDKKDLEKKTVRWNRISLEAAKQCNRGVIPEITSPVNFKKALEYSNDYELGIIPYEREIEGKLSSHIHKGINRVCMFIGPEGGFAEDEIEAAESFGIKPVTLGPRILRTETAGIVALTILMYEMGDVGK